MPSLSDSLHLDMLRASREVGRPHSRGLYGLEWGDPNVTPSLRFVRDHLLFPYINFDHTALEIGPGGGRWTRYMLSFRRVYTVDYHQELLNELLSNFQVPHLTAIKNNGNDFPGIPENCVDFAFSFGVFVHLDRPIIETYLRSLKRVMTDKGNIVIHYSDKTKEEARGNKSFSENTPEAMREMVSQAGYTVLEENLTALPHSSIMRFRKGRL